MLDLLIPKIANVLILNGIVDVKEIKSVKRYDQAVSLTRYYKY